MKLTRYSAERDAKNKVEPTLFDVELDRKFVTFDDGVVSVSIGEITAQGSGNYTASLDFSVSELFLLLGFALQKAQASDVRAEVKLEERMSVLEQTVRKLGELL